MTDVFDGVSIFCKLKINKVTWNVCEILSKQNCYNNKLIKVCLDRQGKKCSLDGLRVKYFECLIYLMCAINTNFANNIQRISLKKVNLVLYKIASVSVRSLDS